jgi:hypothetical protein
MKAWMHNKTCSFGVVLVLSAAPLTLLAQNAPLPVKPGLWEMSVSVSRVMALPPEAEARIAAMPPEQQAQVRAMMSGGAAGGKPMVNTTQVCMAGQASMDTLLNRAQQNPGMQCSFTNRVQTANGASFDISCTGQVGTAKGHTEFHAIDDEHLTSTSHVAITASSQGRTGNTTMDSTTTGKFVSADCGDVKPFTPPPAK